jgi:hypothetical protein
VARDPASTNRGLRVLALCAVAAGLVLLAAAAFVLSYAGVHAVALTAGVSPRLARLYPLILDAMVVVAGAAVLSLRGAGLPSRWYAWLSLLVMLAGDAGADTVHAIGAKLPHKPTSATAAIIPWALVLIGFGLLLTMLRHARLRNEDRRETGPPADETDQAVAAEAVPGAEIGLVPLAELLAGTGPDTETGPTIEDLFQPEDESGPEVEAEAQPQPDAEPEAEPETQAVSPAAASAFDRVRSTPEPPNE